jgi:hypothetical protein
MANPTENLEDFKDIIDINAPISPAIEAVIDTHCIDLKELNETQLADYEKLKTQFLPTDGLNDSGILRFFVARNFDFLKTEEMIKVIHYFNNITKIGEIFYFYFIIMF